MPEVGDRPTYSSRYIDALGWSAELHAKQLRKGTDVPYIVHLLNVSALVWLNGGDEDQAIAGLLHDAVEDQGGEETLDQIRERFGDRVAAIVKACTDADELPKPPWAQRKRVHIEHLSEIREDALLVTAADKFDNITSVLVDHDVVGADIWDRFKGGCEGTVWYYHKMSTALSARLDSQLTQRLAEAVVRLGELAGIDPEMAEPPR